mmetsp:Transcript_17380/g.26304  ORF Transcript_17380/g.26304 Transcript_17380/m.26304 type:complete len:202 (+) Transcript_17380:197-802(+)
MSSTSRLTPTAILLGLILVALVAIHWSDQLADGGTQLRDSIISTTGNILNGSTTTHVNSSSMDEGNQSSHDAITAAKAPKSNKPPESDKDDPRYAMLYYCNDRGSEHVSNTVADKEVNTVTSSDFPPLETLVDGDRIIGDVSHLLSFAIIGFSKCGTTFTDKWAASSPNALMTTKEDRMIDVMPQDFVVQRYKEMEEARSC